MPNVGEEEFPRLVMSDKIVCPENCLLHVECGQGNEGWFSNCGSKHDIEWGRAYVYR